MKRSKQLSRSVEKRTGRNFGSQIFSKVHQEFGGRIRIFVSGGSSLGKTLYRDFQAMGMPIYEGYGLTETAPVLTVNPLHRSRVGSAGKPLPGSLQKAFLQGDVRGPEVFPFQAGPPPDGLERGFQTPGVKLVLVSGQFLHEPQQRIGVVRVQGMPADMLFHQL